MNKSTVKTKIIKELENQLETITHSALEAEQESHQESDVPASQVDHRSLEASLLAKIQSGRVQQAQTVLQIFKDLPLRPFTDEDEIMPTALVELEHDGESHYYFLGPRGAGTVVEYGGHDIEVITPFSPLGEELLDKQVDDQVLVESPKGIQEFIIKSVC